MTNFGSNDENDFQLSSQILQISALNQNERIIKSEPEEGFTARYLTIITD